MASSFQQQARYRKLWYLGIILGLFTLGLIWRRVDANVAGLPVRGINAQAESLAIREESRGEVDMTGSVIRLGLTGSRGVATCFLWNVAIDAQKKNQWNKLEVLVRSLTKLQPHFITPWLFQSWNLSYNVSVESDRVRDKYFYVSRGLELLAQGERQNRDHPDLRWSIGFYAMHKVMQSDDTNYLRSLFQLSMIPPNERDPARFWKSTPQGPEFNYAEFMDFVQKHPQLVRRLREGVKKDNKTEKERLFTAQTPEAVVRFLEENYSVPSTYRTRVFPPNQPAHARSWVRADDEMLRPEERFPLLPPPRASAFDADALTYDSPLRDEHDGYSMSHAWFAYAQESLPAPDPELPGFSQPITDRARQRKPRNMTTLIFRNYPAQGRRYEAERLQQEGWFDKEPWDASDWFTGIPDAKLDGSTVQVGGGREWSREAWERSLAAWRKHGEDNLILFRSVQDEANVRQEAERYYQRTGMDPKASPTPRNEDTLATAERDEYRAARFMFEYNFYRGVSNYPHHYNRAFVQSKPETIACRKLFDRAERLRLNGDALESQRVYRTPIERVDVPAWGKTKLSPLDAWRELVLLKNDEFRRDNFTQEETAEIHLRYLHSQNKLDGVDVKKKLAAVSALLPLVPRLAPEAVVPPIVEGPFDRRYVKDERGNWVETTNGEGEPLVNEWNFDVIIDRMRLPGRRSGPREAPPASAQGTPETKN